MLCAIETRVNLFARPQHALSGSSPESSVSTTREICADPLGNEVVNRHKDIITSCRKEQHFSPWYRFPLSRRDTSGGALGAAVFQNSRFFEDAVASCAAEVPRDRLLLGGDNGQ